MSSEKKRKQPSPDEAERDIDLFDDEDDGVDPTQASRPTGMALAIAPFWDQFERENLLVYRTRDCQTTKLYNSKRMNRPGLQVPAHYGYAFRKYACTGLTGIRGIVLRPSATVEQR
ncbi:hypothetical protein DVH05_009221 [Phytophthora capsici]|nr:hypothetical protein DVH05_009221 [Phytophthora capsici]